ncbi:hypothetical protein TRL7639_03609 [Falsiruegeria litorea R37]|uniref:Lipoprotein n=1 Tax=Falsiruegeria litorea R37 TaxID=1200284 RepID=A0A1Y5TK52_9RHOB|nr:hypothetical protein [Falsiruegeria litorea]SLN63850.1 hypothetical protein TRL7639_03609 [Falsiruegeria litorea R37]
MIAQWTAALTLSVFGCMAWAQDVAEVPGGCTPLATVHKNECRTSTLLMCGQDRQVLTFANGRPDIVHFYDGDWGLAGFLYQANAQTRFERDPGRGAWLNLGDLIADGQDTEDGILLFSTRVVKNREFMFQGAYTLSDEVVELSGHAFRKGTLHREMQREGIDSSWLGFDMDIYVSEALGLFVEGDLTSHARDRASFTADHTPRVIRFEGEPGFLATRSEFGCDG